MFFNDKERILLSMNKKQIQGRGNQCRHSCSYGKGILAVALTVACLTGCGVQHVAEESPESQKPVGELISESGEKPKSPDIPYSEQIDIIMQNKDIWCFTAPDDTGEEYGWNESDYYYWISDMDQNGFLEVISSITTGNGGYFDNDYYEVNPEGKNLIKLKTDESEDAPAADLYGYGHGFYGRGYYDKKTGTYHYPQWDHTHGSAVDTSDAQLDTVLADGELSINTISFRKSMGDGDNVIVKYYAGDRAKKLGTVKEPSSEKAKGFSDARKQEAKYSKQLTALYEQYYKGMQEFTVTAYSFQNIDEEKWEEESEISVVSDEILRKRVEQSWDGFGIHFPKEDAVDNPFLPEKSTEDAEIHYLLYMLSEGKATIQMQEELRGEDSILYQVRYSDPREVSNREGDLSEKEEKKFVKQQFKQTYFYLWVTDTQIYYIPRFYPKEDFSEDSSISNWKQDFGNDFSIDPELDEDFDEDYQKARLVFYHEIPEYARLVCQEEELEDALEEEAEGNHQWIEKHGEDIRCYRSYTSRGEGYEGTNILQFIWKRGEGLIGMRYAAHAAGGGGKIFWKEACLEQDDGWFSIDNDTED